jgi:succinoglycan biosynthesis transport protein ExoP
MNELLPYISRRDPSSSENNNTFNRPFVDVGPEMAVPVFRDYWRVIRKHKGLIAVFFFGVIVTTVIATWMTIPIYSAMTTILIERKGPEVVNVRQVLAEPLGHDDYDYYKTQYQVLKSRSLIAQVIRERDLENDALFTAPGAGFFTKHWSEFQAWAIQFLRQPSKAAVGDSSAAKSHLIGMYQNMLEIRPVSSTRLVNIIFNSPDPELSTRVVNAHADAYIRQGVSIRSTASQEAQRFLEEKLVELRNRLENSEEELNTFRRRAGIISLDDKENIVVDRLADLNKRLTEAEADRIGLEAQVRLIHNRDYDSLPAVINNGLIQALKGQLVRLDGEHAHLATQYKAGYPRLAQLKAQLDETGARLQQEVHKVVEGITSAYMAAGTKEKELRGRMEEQKAATLRLKDASIEYAVLAREVDTNRQLYASVLERMKEVGLAAEVRTSNIFVIDKAEIPLGPAKPNATLNLLLGAGIGLIGGLGLAFLFEYFDESFSTPEEVERYLRLPNLATVPDFRINGFGPKALRSGVDRKRIWSRPDKTKEVMIASYPSSYVNEAYRTLRTSILLSHAGEPPKTILFTSAAQGEGKSATAVNSAAIFAQMGVKVLLIDADLRRSSCHKLLGMRRELGLADLLSGQIDATRAIRQTRMNKLDFISSGSSAPNPTELVGSKAMYDCLNSLRQRYDFIIVDSPPAIPVSDALLVSRMVDGVVLVTNGQETPRYAAMQASLRLGHAGCKILGTVLNRVNVHRKYAQYLNGSYVSTDPAGT